MIKQIAAKLSNGTKLDFSVNFTKHFEIENKVRTLFLIEEIPSSGIVIIDGDEGHHAATVLRIEVGE